MRILPNGDAALLAEFASLDDVLAHYRALDADRPHGVVDLVPAARTVLVRFEPREIRGDTVRRWIAETPPVDADTLVADEIVIDVRYDGPDLTEVGERTGLGADGVISAHTDRAWTVAFGGFAPGFAYLTGGDDRLQVPRRESPRVAVPAGAVGLAGEFSGIYPRQSPGGWQLIGTTDAELWQPDRIPAALLRPGVRVRFRPVRHPLVTESSAPDIRRTDG
ncbi:MULTISPECIES: 5-oxoprolinase subunit B family protein [unclassified Rhodococcus (in: high G+C Gram-positive bacteria)]|uniref:5-oxoprolinase subunit B family protein n=1 Tax=unclassified Rhodococcus (in: high G+C Gram-positive bacteria) TaxID=192944 RepID=UPI00146F56E5|nr:MULTISPECIES: allophanate hydrolase subunit 1 [unclassified Rhodococcus (in: high G+C Gram-positive bacteria)]MBF0663672.1 allophanate hydrolase subunit 1 [Rhodococcus sp. (in: high G+C Gram-positive bacteria)]NMD97463.1 allophanate hydrolase subunit 1 [Rhodococcus sp. BL-253-APC-6A1W]NME81338.1 allophanate hydrolase subunit 1 [Rhodococcus sp. 105337]